MASYATLKRDREEGEEESMEHESKFCKQISLTEEEHHEPDVDSEKEKRIIGVLKDMVKTECHQIMKQLVGEEGWKPSYEKGVFCEIEDGEVIISFLLSSIPDVYALAVIEMHDEDILKKNEKMSYHDGSWSSVPLLKFIETGYVKQAYYELYLLLVEKIMQYFGCVCKEVHDSPFSDKDPCPHGILYNSLHCRKKTNYVNIIQNELLRTLLSCRGKQQQLSLPLINTTCPLSLCTSRFEIKRLLYPNLKPLSNNERLAEAARDLLAMGYISAKDHQIPEEGITADNIYQVFSYHTTSGNPADKKYICFCNAEISRLACIKDEMQRLSNANVLSMVEFEESLSTAFNAGFIASIVMPLFCRLMGLNRSISSALYDKHYKVIRLQTQISGVSKGSAINTIHDNTLKILTHRKCKTIIGLDQDKLSLLYKLCEKLLFTIREAYFSYYQ